MNKGELLQRNQTTFPQKWCAVISQAYVIINERLVTSNFLRRGLYSSGQDNFSGMTFELGDADNQLFYFCGL